MLDISTITIALLIILIVATVAVFLTRKKRPMSQDQFSKAVAAKISRDFPEIKIKDVNGFECKIDREGKEETFYLDNLYRNYCVAPSDFEEMTTYFLRSMIAPKQTTFSWEEVKPRLLLSVKSQEYFQAADDEPMLSEIINNMLSFDYNGALKEVVAIDSEITISLVSKSQLAEWGVSADEVRKCARENLAKLTAPHWVEANDLAKRHGVFVFNVMDGYDAARLLLPDFYERASRALGCEKIAVAVPNRDFLVAFSADNQEMLARQKRQIASDFEKYGHTISPEVFFLP